jgi:hypothetical protein
VSNIDDIPGADGIDGNGEQNDLEIHGEKKRKK